MSSFKRFEDLPVWKAAVDMAVAVFRLTGRDSFKFKGDLVNQCRRAALSVSNNIAEGFERGTTSELITFLYIARGSAGEVRSMLRFALQLGEMPGDAQDIQSLVGDCEAISRQLRAWLDSLQNSDIQGQRHLNESSRLDYDRRKAREAFEAQMAEFREKFEQRLRGERPAADERVAEAATPACPVCGKAMARRRSGDGKDFWGCTAYPLCKGTRSI